MNYRREIPRDLFNEANLLKCHGQLWLELENAPSGTMVDIIHRYPNDPFKVRQDPADGSLSIENVTLFVRGYPYLLTRPLNSREPWPLYAQDVGDPDSDQVDVFTPEGKLSAAFRKLIGWTR